MTPPPLITMLTDFGLSDGYVGMMKGVILSRLGAATLVDISHNIPAGDIAVGARALFASYRFFPPKTVHLVVVDPGVGTSRKILALRSADHFFVGPDNGVFTALLQADLVREIRVVTNTALFPPNPSTTFHGRDIMAPVAAAIAGGLPLEEIGPPLAPSLCRQISLPATEHLGHQIIGTVIHVDHFGNLQTSITTEDLAKIPPKAELTIHCCQRTIQGLHRSYGAVAQGEFLALIDSQGHLEIAVGGGNAARELECGTGEPVTLVWPT